MLFERGVRIPQRKIPPLKKGGRRGIWFRQSFLFRWRKLVGLLAYFEHPMAQDGVGIGKNRRGLHGSFASQPEAVNGYGSNYVARLTLYFSLFITVADE